jgi:hypothetical protein
MELRKCPFCGGKITTNGLAPDLDYNELAGKWMLHHVCLHDVDFTNGVSILISGEKQEVIDKWNGVYEEQESESL